MEDSEVSLLRADVIGSCHFWLRRACGVVESIFVDVFICFVLLQCMSCHIMFFCCRIIRPWPAVPILFSFEDVMDVLYCELCIPGPIDDSFKQHTSVIRRLVGASDIFGMSSMQSVWWLFDCYFPGIPRYITSGRSHRVLGSSLACHLPNVVVFGATCLEGGTLYLLLNDLASFKRPASNSSQLLVLDSYSLELLAVSTRIYLYSSNW